MLPEYFEFSIPTKVVYGIGIIHAIESHVKRFGNRKAILVTDKVLVAAGLVEKVKNGFASTGIEIACIYDNVPPNSTLKAVEECAALARENSCNMLIAVGGGSVIDTAKVANLMIVKGGDLTDHMGAYLLDRNEELLPLIVLPTTAGTGSEVTKVAVIADPQNDVKLPFAEEQFLPKLAILDPELTTSMPAKLTAMTGMDALTHAIEAYVDKEHSPASDALAIHAIRLISSNILKACAHPLDLDARGNMLIGSFLAGLAFSHSMVGMAHGIAHALGGVYHIPHGLANALVLPEVMAYNLDSETDRYADIAIALGISFPEIIHQSKSLIKSGSLVSLTSKFELAEMIRQLLGSLSYKARNTAAKIVGNLDFVDDWVRKQAAWAGIEKIRTLNRQLAYLTKMPLNLKDAGISDHLAKLDQLVNTAMEDGSMIYNPKEPTREVVTQIIKKLYFTRMDPLPVSDADLISEKTTSRKKEMTNVFKDSEMLYAIFGEFYELLKTDPDIAHALKKAKICVQFVYQNPSATITIDSTGENINIIKGEFQGKPEVIMTMNADFAHRFWHGKANLVTALTRRQVIAKGNVPKTIKLLPILKPAYTKYPKFLIEKGFGQLVIQN